MQPQREPARRRLPAAVSALALTFTGGAVLAPPAAAGAVDRVCATSAGLYESPSGLQIGVVAEGRAVIIMRRAANGRWVRVRTHIGARGWMKSRLLCDKGR